MIDFVLLIGNKNVFKDFSVPPHHSSKSYLKRKFESPYCIMAGFSYEDEDDYYEDENVMVACSGRIFRRLTNKTVSDKSVLAEISDINVDGKTVLKKYKGNFCLLICDKKSGSVKVLNDHFAVRPVYYCNKDGNYIISSSLNYLRKYDFSINYSSVFEQLLYTYPVSDDTLLEGVKYLNGGDEISYQDDAVAFRNNFNTREYLYNLDDRKFDKDVFTELFNSSVLQRAANGKKNIVSLTAGFDGRTIVSALLKYKVDFSSYSFGMKCGINTDIPLKISEVLGIEYTPVYLDNEYVLAYNDYAESVILDSDGASFNERANYGFSFDRIASGGANVITGLIGGEIFRPVHLRTDYMNQFYYDTVYQGKEINAEKYFGYGFSESLLSCDINEYMGKLSFNVKQRRELLNDFKDAEKGYMYYLLDLLTLGFRRYYGTEIHFERYYAENLTPMFDIDIIDYLFNTDYSEIYKNAFRDSRVFRWKGQKIYAQIIRRNMSRLGEITTDRGYPPSYLNSCLKIPLVPLKYKARQRILRNNSNPDFDEKYWCMNFVRQFADLGPYNEPFFNLEGIKRACGSYSMDSYNKDFNRMLSLLSWMKGFSF